MYSRRAWQEKRNGSTYVGVEDVGTTDHSLIWKESQQTKARGSRRGRKLHKWRIDKLEMEEKRQEFQEAMAKNAVKVCQVIWLSPLFRGVKVLNTINFNGSEGSEMVGGRSERGYQSKERDPHEMLIE